MSARFLGASAALLLALVVPAFGGDGTEERLSTLEQQNREILDRLRKSESENGTLRDEVSRMREEGARRLSAEIEQYLSANSAEAAGEGGLTTKAGAIFEIYGFVRLDLYFDTARASNVIIPFTVAAENGTQADSNNESFALDARLTRLGFNFNFGQVGSSAVTAKLETDFANFPAGVPESRETPRIRLAYINIEAEKWRLRMGQDWDIASAMFPSANNETLMWNNGNLGDRRPMIAFTYKASGKLEVTFALALTGAINNQDLDAAIALPATPPFSVNERDGFDTGIPHAQVRAQYTGDSWVEGKQWVVAVMGIAGKLETDALFGGENEWTFWAVGLDFKVPVSGKVFVMGEIWTGQALGDHRGNIGLVINSTTGKEIEGWGGWIEGQYKHDDHWTFLLGGSVDDPDNADIGGSSPNLNCSGYVGTRYQWSKNLVSAFDVIFWETQYAGTNGLGNMLRFNFWTSVNF